MGCRLNIQLTGLNLGMGLQIKLFHCATLLVLCAVFFHTRKDLVGTLQQMLL